jgi:hypothetical protein
MESGDEPEIYVCDPVYTKDGVKGHTSYSLKGSRVPEPLIRRYKDFDALRKKLVERWPGIFIPNIPHKKKVGNKGKRIIGLRLKMINKFLKKLSKLEYLFNSEEMELFLQNTSSVSKTLEGIKLENYEDLLKKYTLAFTEYDDNFDTTTGKEEQDKFLKKLTEIYPKVKYFRSLVCQAKEKYKADQDNYLAVINMLSVYEKENLNTFVNSEEDKLVFFNMNNIEICENISKIQEQVINPYDRLYDAITEDYLNTEAMIEGLETLKNLQDTYNKLQKNLNNTNTILNELQAGKSTVKTMFKKKEKEMSKLSTEKEEIEKNISNLGEIIKIATFNMQNTIENFKTISLDNYYAELSRIEGDTEKNGTIFDDLWETVVKDKNISEFN